MGSRRLIRALLVACSAALIAVSAYRAATYPFAHDESLSYTIFTTDPVRGFTANHHVLNTWLMQASSVIFGDAPLSLRAPNLVAHAAYLASVLWLVGRLRSIAAQLAGFALLNLNLFALDFFALARGYGLGLGATAVSLALLALALDRKAAAAPFVPVLLGSIAAGALSALANYAFLNAYLPILLAAMWLLLTDRTGRAFSRTHWLTAFAVVIAAEALLAGVGFHLLQLQRDGQLYFGGSTGLVSDTLLSLVRGTVYRAGRADTALMPWAIGLACSLVAVGLAAIVTTHRDRAITPLAVAAVLLVLAVGLPIAEHALAGALFPIDRAAVYYVPLFGWALMLTFDTIATRPAWSPVRWTASATASAAAVALVWLFASGLDLDSNRTWPADAHNVDVLEIVDRDRRQRGLSTPVRLGVSWVFEPSMSFYRRTRDYSWLAEVRREGLADPDNTYVYAFEHDVAGLATTPGVVLTRFPDIGTVLWRRD